jgi:hypothetical protein
MKAVNQAGVCFICRRRDGGLGVDGGAKRNHVVGWMCQRCAEAGLGWPALEAAEPAFDACEQRALTQAGDAAGRTDMAELHPDEWRHLLLTVVTGFADGIRREVMSAAEKGQL